MKLPRNLPGEQLIKALNHFGYRATRQTGSHVRLPSELPEEHHLTVPPHGPLRAGTLAAIFADVAAHHGVTRERLSQNCSAKVKAD